MGSNHYHNYCLSTIERECHYSWLPFSFLQPLEKAFLLVKFKRHLVEMFNLRELLNFLRNLWDVVYDIVTVGG